jgi:hypothetical protein
MRCMKRYLLASVVALHGCAAAPAAQPPSQPVAAAARFDAAGELLPPTDYRSWVFLTSGFAMAYGPVAKEAEARGVQVLDNVFVERGPYDQFLRSGTWPESTLFVLEVRAGEHTGSIVTTGHFQTDILAIEAEIKDSRRFPSGWGFFDFEPTATGPAAPARVLPRDAACYDCHARNAAVENTFTQFYPTLFPVARARGTIRRDFVGIPPNGAELYDQVVAHGGPAGRAMIDDTAVKWPDANLLREATLARTAARLVQAHRTQDAVTVLAETARRFPDSASAWDSLAEVYEGAHQFDDARRANARGLAVLAGDGALTGPRRDGIERALNQRAARLTTR